MTDFSGGRVEEKTDKKRNKTRQLIHCQTGKINISEKEKKYIRMERKIQFMLSQKSTMKTKLENMYLQKRISYGYRKVINMMLLSGVISIIAIGILFANMMNYVNNVNAADQAVKTCRININTAARNIREMALNDDESTYDSYEEKVKELLGIVDTQMNVLHGTGVITEDLYTEYKGAFTD